MTSLERARDDLAVPFFCAYAANELVGFRGYFFAVLNDTSGRLGACLASSQKLLIQLLEVGRGLSGFCLAYHHSGCTRLIYFRKQFSTSVSLFLPALFPILFAGGAQAGCLLL